MSEDQLGSIIKEGFLFFRQIFSDVAKMMQTVDDRMNYHSMEALMGSRSTWGRSNSISVDTGWMIHYLARIFVPSSKKDKNPSIKSDAIFFNVYFEPKLLSQPIVCYGVIRHPVRGIDVLPEVKTLLATDNGPEFITIERVQHWDMYTFSKSFHLLYNVQPLTDFSDKMAVDDVCDKIVGHYNIFNENKTGDRYRFEEIDEEKILESIFTI